MGDIRVAIRTLELGAPRYGDLRNSDHDPNKVADGAPHASLGRR
jgi:hypothetical protein